MSRTDKRIGWFIGIVGLFIIVLGVLLAASSDAKADTTTPTATVVNVTSPALDPMAKPQFELIDPSAAKVKGCKKVKSFAKRGRKTCISLPIGAKYTLLVRDRNGATHVVSRKVVKSTKLFYKGSDGKWRMVSTNSYAFVGAAEYHQSQYVLYQSFPAAPFAVQISYTVVSDLDQHAGNDGCNTTQTGPGHGVFTDLNTVVVMAKYTSDAKSLAPQQLPKEWKDAIANKAIADAKQHQQTNTTQMLCGINPVITDPAQQPLISVNITNGPLDVHVSKLLWIYAEVKNVNGHAVSFDFDQPAFGYIGPKKSSNTFDNQTCPAGYSCFAAQYKAPSTPGDDFVSASAVQDDGNNFGGDIVYINVLDDNE
jgi:hypothetical protein